MSGKGDNPRPFSVPEHVFSNNWDSIFGKKDTGETYKGIAIQADAPDRKASLIDLGDGTYAVAND